MNCKHCQAPLEDGNWICPSCGWDNTPEEEDSDPVLPEENTVQEDSLSPDESPTDSPEELPAPESKPVNQKKLALVIGGIVLLLALVAVAVWALTRQDRQAESPASESTTAPSETLSPEETVEPTGVLSREVYAYEGEDITPELSKVVSTMDDATLTNGLLQILYWRSYYDFLNTYSSYLSYMGLNTTQPLSEQTCSLTGTSMTWEQYFLENALMTWAQHQALYNEAKANGYTLSEEAQTQLDTSAEQLATSAQQYGFDSVQAMLEADFGAGVTEETYQAYLELYLTSMDYYFTQMDAMAPSEEEVEAYYQENEESFTQQGIEQDDTPATISVRHILIQPEGDMEGTDDSGNAVYSEEQLAEAKDKAQELYDQWLAGEATETSFADLVADNSADAGSVSNGGLYEDVTPGQMVDAFNDWCFDPARKPGDTGLVETSFGCHIMYFVSASEETYWYYAARSSLGQERSTQYLQDCLDRHPYETDFDAIVLTQVETSTAY